MRQRDPLDVHALRDEVLGAESAWRQLDVVEQTGSTNADLLARAAAGVDIGASVLIAEHQTAGRGRLGRSWSAAPRAQLTMSVGVVVRDVPTVRWGWLPLATGLAVLDAVAPLLAPTAVETGLKWPNDVLAGSAAAKAKLAGILVEIAQPFAVIGVGLNVTQAPEEVDGPGATSLFDLGVSAPDRDQLACRLLRELAARIAQWRLADPQLITAYRAVSLTIGSRVCAQLPGGRELVGTALDIDEQGRLCVQTRAGGPDASQESVLVSAGDVVHLR